MTVPDSDHSKLTGRIGRNCTLWVNDTADYRPADHGHGYQDRVMPVQVSFISRSGQATRASFDTVTGAVTWFVLPPEGEDHAASDESRHAREEGT